MMRKASTIIVIFILTLSGCQARFTNYDSIPGYNLATPDVTIILPHILREVSGLTCLNSASVACIQDENGILFIYNILENKLESQFTFNGNGDYEGITRVDKAIYILKSDGVLFEISDYTTRDFKVKSYFTGIPAEDNEGLCYDQENNRLLVAPKGKIGERPEYKDKRAIYGFNLKTKLLDSSPVFDLDLNDIRQFALSKKIFLPSKTNKKGEYIGSKISFKASAIGIHPLTKRLYLISDADHVMFIFNMNGNIEHIVQLDPVMFNQAEGITFLDNGDMLITNEGQDKKPTLLRFNYRPEQ